MGRVGRYDRAAAPHVRVGPRDRALSRVQRPPQWRAELAPAALTPRRRRELDKHPPAVHFLGSRRNRTIKLASRGGEYEFLVSYDKTRNACDTFAFNTTVADSIISSELSGESRATSCWSSQELWSAAARSAGGYEGPYGTAVSPAHPGLRESVPAQRARAAELAFYSLV